MSGLWTAFDYPAVATKATATKAANSSSGPETLRVRDFTISVAGAAAASGPIRAVLWDGAVGGGTELWSGVLQANIDGSASISVTGVDLRATVGNDINLDTDAPAAGCQAAVTMSGDLARTGGIGFGII